MKVHIRDRNSGLFFQSDGTWVQQPGDALSFDSFPAALQAIPSCGRTNVEVFLPDTDVQMDQSRDETLSPRQADTRGQKQHWKFVVFVSAWDSRMETLIQNLRRLIREHTGSVCEIDIVDVVMTPQIAEEFKIASVPTIVRVHPTPVRKLIGPFSNEAVFLAALGLGQTEDGIAP